jgi:N-glycosylase/DNA lyase
MLGTESSLHSCGNATGAGENGEMRNRWTESERYFVNVTQFIYGKVCQFRKILREWTKFLSTSTGKTVTDEARVSEETKAEIVSAKP